MEQIVTNKGIKLYEICRNAIFNDESVEYLGKIKYKKEKKKYSFVPAVNILSYSEDSLKDIYYIIQGLKKKHKL